MDGGAAPETVVVGGRASRRERDAVPAPLVVLAVVLAASVALGAWLNDAGPWAPETPTLNRAIIAYIPPPGGDPSPTPVIADADRVRMLLGSLLGDSEIDVADSVDDEGGYDSTEVETYRAIGTERTDMAGFCSLRAVPEDRRVQVAWARDAAPMPDSVEGELIAFARATGWDVQEIGAQNSLADLYIARDDLRSPRGDRALRTPRSVARNELPRGLTVTGAEIRNDQQCTGLDVWYARKDLGALATSRERDLVVARVLEDDVTGGVAVVAHRDRLEPQEPLPTAGDPDLLIAGD